MKLPPDELREVRTAAWRKLPSLLWAVLQWNLLAVVALLYMTRGAPGDAPRLAMRLLLHPATLGTWAAGPSLIIWLFHRSMSLDHAEHGPLDIPTPGIAFAMIIMHLLCIAGAWMALR